jgi:hypothetical protein
MLNTLNIQANLSHTTVRMRLVIALVNLRAELTSSVEPVAAEVLTEMVTPLKTQISNSNTLKRLWKKRTLTQRTLMPRHLDNLLTSLRLGQRASADCRPVELNASSPSNTGLLIEL